MAVVIIIWLGILRLENSEDKPKESAPNPIELLIKNIKSLKKENGKRRKRK